MLRNPVYLGHVIGGKKEQVNPKIKKAIQKKKEEYIIIKNKHEAIIEEQLWKKAQEKLNTYPIKKVSKYQHILKGIVYCKECGKEVRYIHHKSVTKTGKVWEQFCMICGNKNSNKPLCYQGAVIEKKLLACIQKIIKEEVKRLEYSLEELDKICDRIKRRESGKSTLLEEKIQGLDNEFHKLENEIANCYNKKIEKNISSEEFKQSYQKYKEQEEKITNQILALTKQKEKREENKQEEKSKYEKVVYQFLLMEKLDKEILKKLIEKIEIDKEKNIIVKLKFKSFIKDKMHYEGI